MKLLALFILLAGCTSATEPLPPVPQCGVIVFHDTNHTTTRVPYCAIVK